MTAATLRLFWSRSRDGSATIATRMAVRIAPALLLLAACGGDDGVLPPDAGVSRAQVALVPVVETRDVDVLYVVDDSASVLHLQTSLKAAFPAFLDELATRGVLPNLHIGVVSTDLGTLGAEDTEPGPSIGSGGAGSCSGRGKDARLLTNGATMIQGAFISDIGNTDGTRTTNYTGTLNDAFSAVASIGSSGCGFEQPMEAMKRALDNHPMNADFVRPDAALAVIMMVDEDDCSFTHSTLIGTDTATLGPLQSFRCTRFGVTCDEGGATPDEMSAPGEKHGCHWNESSEYLTSSARYLSFLDGLKADRRRILFGALTGPPTPFEVELRTPPGGGEATPAMAHACTFIENDRTAAADPAVRIHDFAQMVPRGRAESLCMEDFTAPSLAMAREIRGMLGDSCLTRDIALPADCEVLDQTRTSEHELPPCSAAQPTECYQLVEDPACTTSQHLRVEVTRSTEPPADTMVAVRCKL